MNRIVTKIVNKTFKGFLFKNNIKQKDIAVSAGVSQAYISMIVNGAVLPCRSIMERICFFLKCEPEEIGFINYETGDYIQIDYHREFMTAIKNATAELNNGKN